MAESHRASRNDWAAIDCRDRHRGVVNDAIDDLLSHLWLNGRRIRSDAGHFPGELFFARKLCLRGMDLYVMDLHFRPLIRAQKLFLSAVFFVQLIKKRFLDEPLALRETRDHPPGLIHPARRL